MNKLLGLLIWLVVLVLWGFMIMWAIAGITSPIQKCKADGFNGAELHLCVVELKEGRR